VAFRPPVTRSVAFFVELFKRGFVCSVFYTFLKGAWLVTFCGKIGFNCDRYILVSLCRYRKPSTVFILRFRTFQVTWSREKRTHTQYNFV